MKRYSIKSLYMPALAEGEGVGTAYEYFAKRLVLAGWLKQQPRPRTLLIAGLPQKYGASLDFLLLAQELGTAVTVVDERQAALEKLQRSLAAARRAGWLTAVEPTLIEAPALTQVNGRYDLVLSSEVLQRLAAAEQALYVQRMVAVGTAVALFCPNGDNPVHTNLSGLAGLTLAELTALAQQSGAAAHKTGYIDMPPFPPGMMRDEAQRAQASSGTLEAVAMWGLGYYARLEQLLPTAVRRRQSHIVYALLT